MKRKWLIPLVCTAILLTGCANYGEEDLSKAFEALEGKSYQEAANEFNAAIKKAEEDNNKHETSKEVLRSAYRGLGMMYYEESDYGQCLENLQKALDLGGKQTTEVYNLIGISQMNLEDYTAAEEAFSSGIALAGSEEDQKIETMLQEMYYNRVICYEQLTDWAKAKEAAQEYIERYPNDERMQKEDTFLSTR